MRKQPKYSFVVIMCRTVAIICLLPLCFYKYSQYRSDLNGSASTFLCEKAAPEPEERIDSQVLPKSLRAEEELNRPTSFPEFVRDRKFRDTTGPSGIRSPAVEGGANSQLENPQLELIEAPRDPNRSTRTKKAKKGFNCKKKVSWPSLQQAVARKKYKQFQDRLREEQNQEEDRLREEQNQEEERRVRIELEEANRSLIDLEQRLLEQNRIIEEQNLLIQSTKKAQVDEDSAEEGDDLEEAQVYDNNAYDGDLIPAEKVYHNPLFSPRQR